MFSSGLWWHNIVQNKVGSRCLWLCILGSLKLQRHLRYSSETPTFYQNNLAMSNTADVTCGKPMSSDRSLLQV
jgi:hypothetical protein